MLPDAAISGTVSYAYDRLGNLVQKDVGAPGGLARMVHDDPVAPRRLKKAYTQTGDSSPAITLAYDLAGNVTTRTQGGVAKTLTYDSEGRLISVSGASPVSYGWSGLGARLRTSQNSATIDEPEPDFEFGSTNWVILHLRPDCRLVVTSNVGWCLRRGRSPAQTPARRVRYREHRCRP